LNKEIERVKGDSKKTQKDIIYMRIDRLSSLFQMLHRLFILFLSLYTEKAVRLRCIRLWISFWIWIRKKRTAYSDTSCSDRTALAALVEL